jgi:hypothetical protein
VTETMTSGTRLRPPTTGSTPKLSDVARHVVLPAGIVSTGWPAVRDTCARLDVGFDPWQHGAGRAILGKTDDGLYAADAVVMSIPRQVGKTYLVGWIVFALCLIFPGLTVLWTAHRYKTSTETFNSLRAMTQRPRARAHVLKVTQGAGDQVIYFRNGSRILFGARERGFGRGFTDVDVEVFDEAQILSDAAIDDMIPATNVAPNPLIIYMGTPPKPTDPGEVFTRHRTEALSGESVDELYIELSADDDADPLDRAQWSKANPSFPHRTTERAMLRMRKNLTPDAFLREGLGIWNVQAETMRHPLDRDGWVATARLESPDRSGAPAFFVTIGVDGIAVVAVASRAAGDERPHVELARRVSSSSLGQTLEDLRDAWPGAVFGAGKAGPVAGIVEAGVPVEVQLLTAGELAQACGHHERLHTDRAYTHSADPDVTASFTGAASKPAGDGLWTWDWRASANLAAIAAETGALWLLETSPGGEPTVYVF